MDEADEPDVARRLAAGDPAAWAAVYTAFAPRVWASVARLVGPCPAAVADVTQETFLAAARSARGYDPGRGRLWPWLWGIAHSQAALYHRKRARLARVHAAVPVPDRGPATDPLEEAETAGRVRATLAALPADYAGLLSATYFDGLPAAAIADRERLTESAVRSKLARARAAFRTLYARSGPVS